MSPISLYVLIFVFTLAYFFSHSILALSTTYLLMALVYQTVTPLLMTSLFYFPHQFLDILINGLQIVFPGIYGSPDDPSVALGRLKNNPHSTGINPQGSEFGFPLICILCIWTQLSQPQNLLFSYLFPLLYPHWLTLLPHPIQFFLGFQCVVILTT